MLRGIGIVSVEMLLKLMQLCRAFCLPKVVQAAKNGYFLFVTCLFADGLIRKFCLWFWMLRNCATEFQTVFYVLTPQVVLGTVE